MGKYVTTTSISNWLPNYLKGNTTTSDTAGTAFFSECIDDAEATTDSAIAKRYALPLTPVPPLLRTITKDIACWRAIRNGFTQEGRVKNVYLDDYNRAMDMLDNLMSGKIQLADTAGSVIATNSSGKFLSSDDTYVPAINQDDEKAWAVDPDKADAITDGRK